MLLLKNCKVNLDFELEIIHELLEKGADPNTEFKGDKAIYKDICSELQESGKYKNIVDSKIRCNYVPFANFTTSSITALHIAAYYGAVNLVNKLLKSKADPDARDKNCNTAVHFALAAIVKKKNFFHKKEQLERDVSSQFAIIKLLTLAGASTNISIHCANLSKCNCANFSKCDNSSHYDYTP